MTLTLSLSSSGARVRLRGLSRSFGERAVLDRVDLDVEPGAFVAVVGRSGCGKSTLLRQIARLDAPTRGDVRVEGGTTRVMFQEPRLLPWKRVLDNVAVGLPETLDLRERRRRAAAALADVGLSERADAWPGVLSGGQKQRVALARALVSRPALLLFDEPLGALDALTRIEMQRLIERIYLHEGFTAVMVTHDVSEAVALADRILLVEDGRIALDEAVSLARPRRRGDAGFAALEARILDRLLAA